MDVLESRRLMSATAAVATPQPVPQLSGNFVTSASYTIGKKALAALVVHNDGTSVFRGSLTASVVLAANANGTGEIGDTPVLVDRRVALRPDKSAVLRARVPTASQLGPGTYFFAATVQRTKFFSSPSPLLRAVSGPVQLVEPPTHGLFGQPQLVSVSDARAITSADFNGDGNPDLAIANQTGIVQILLGKGDGTFSSPRDVQVDPAGPQNDTVISIVAADFNNDGRTDLAVGGLIQGGQHVLALLGNGDGTFRMGPTVQTGVESLAAADFNGDGKTDLLTVDANTPAPFGVRLLIGNGDGSFQHPRQVSAFPGQQTPQAIATADFNGDGHADFALAGTFIFLGNGDGTFAAPVAINSGGYGSSIVVADLNGDSHPDLAVANEGNADMGVLLNDGRGGFRLAGVYTVPSSAPSIAAASNGGRPADVLVGDNFIGVSQFRNNGRGTFTAGSLLPQMPDPLDMVTADFNHDGKADLAVVGNGELAIFMHV